MRGEVSDKMDVYSFGVVLLEIITSIPAIGKLNTSFCLICYEFNSAGTEINALERFLNFLPSVQILNHQFKSSWFFIFELVIQDLNWRRLFNVQRPLSNLSNSTHVEIILYYKICRTLEDVEFNVYNIYVLILLLVSTALYRHC